MPISGTVFVRSTAAMLIVALCALLVIVGTSLWLVERTQGYFDDVIAAREIRASAVDLRNSMLNAETGQRGYLLTQDESYLAPYSAAVPNVSTNYDKLIDKLKNDTDSMAVLGPLKAGIDDKLAEMDNTITLGKAGKFNEALAVVQTGQGKSLMDDVRNVLRDVIAKADQQLLVAVDDQRGSANALRLVTVIGALVIVIVVGGSAWTVMVHTRDLAAARLAVEMANTGLEERVRERTSDLGRANEEIQRFAYIVTHDLRAPLVNIMGFTSELETSAGTMQAFMAKLDDTENPELREAKLAATEDLPEAIGFIRSSTRKMDGLINAILKISREGTRMLKPESVDLKAMLDAAAASIHHQVAENNGVINVSTAIASVVSDRLSLEQVFGNLLDNAVKYRDPSRPLQVDVRTRRGPGDHVVIDVADNGRGIAEQDHERVFELFRRSGVQSQPGEGIGLAHVRTMVRSLGGDITLQSRLGAGTTFSISLPRDVRTFLGSQNK